MRRREVITGLLHAATMRRADASTLAFVALDPVGFGAD